MEELISSMKTFTTDMRALTVEVARMATETSLSNRTTNRAFLILIGVISMLALGKGAFELIMAAKDVIAAEKVSVVEAEK